MFSGIIEVVTEVLEVETKAGNKIFTLRNPFEEKLYIDQSIAHNGACLTVIEIKDNYYKVEAIEETLRLTNLDFIKEGDQVNLERSIKADTRLDGHIVAGHVDDLGTCVDIIENNGSWDFSFSFPASHQNLVISKGSITINGISLTVSQIIQNKVTVSIIPYTYEHTNLKNLEIGSKVNLEFDSIGKYVVKYLSSIKV